MFPVNTQSPGPSCPLGLSLYAVPKARNELGFGRPGALLSLTTAMGDGPWMHLLLNLRGSSKVFHG